MSPFPDKLIAHIAQVMLDDGDAFFWIVSNSPEPPDIDNLPAEIKHGPFKSVEAAIADCDRALSLMGVERTVRRL